MFESEELMARIVDLEEQLKVSEMAPPAAEQLIARLEGEIAKRDARIVELESDLAGTQSRVLSLQDQWRKLDAELAAIKAQEPVAWEVYYADDDSFHAITRNKMLIDGYSSMAYVIKPLYAAPVSEVKAQGVVLPERKQYHDYLSLYDKGEAIGHNNALSEVARLNAATVQQVSVPASAFASRAITHYEAALLAAFPSGSSGEVFNQWNEARRVLAAAPAAPAADGWISVSERLPGEDDQVLCWCEDETVAWAEVSSHHNSFFTDMTHELLPVTHWMPLPAAPSAHSAKGVV